MHLGLGILTLAYGHDVAKKSTKVNSHDELKQDHRDFLRITPHHTVSTAPASNLGSVAQECEGLVRKQHEIPHIRTNVATRENMSTHSFCMFPLFGLRSGDEPQIALLGTISTAYGRIQL